jgi:threonine dehydratase
MALDTSAVTLDSIRDAAAHIYDLVVRTPLVRLEVPPAWRTRWPEAPAALYLKLETLQPVGSFKIRGAYNAVRQLTPEERRDGIWTVSAGNAAQGVALAARHVGASCSVLIPETAPETKRQAIARFGATMVTAPWAECWKAVETGTAEGMHGYFVHPFADARFISGNGTAGLELVEDLPAVDSVVASVGGGGLLAGVAVAVRALRPDVRLFSAEPETGAPLALSRRIGEASRFADWQPTFIDGAGTQAVLPEMWPRLRDLDDAIVVSLEDVQAAMRLVAEQVHVIAEGAGAMAVAAALTGRAGRGTVAVIVSGGNIDLSRFTALVADMAPARPVSLTS